jgi:hypothetical protein
MNGVALADGASLVVHNELQMTVRVSGAAMKQMNGVCVGTRYALFEFALHCD